jgi:hypothetical protein
MTKDTGGPAFPTDVQRKGLNGDIMYGKADGGMTLRDYFAADAMSAIIACGYGVIVNGESKLDHDIVAKASYLYADAMLKERLR